MQENVNFKLSDEQLFVVAESFLEQKSIENVLQIITSISDPKYFEQLSKICLSLGNDERQCDILVLLAKVSTIREENWNNIWKLISTERNNKNNTGMSTLIYIAAGLARLNSWSLLPETGHSPTKKEISEFLREEIIRKHIHKSLDIPEEILIDVGTAIEKAGRRIDALDYYKQIESYVKNEEIKLKSIERWIKVKERQAELTNDDDELAEKRKQEAINKRKSYNILGDKDFPEYEILSEWSDLYRFIVKNETTLEKSENGDAAVVNIPSKSGIARVKVISNKGSKLKNNIVDSTQSQLTNLEFEINGFKLSYFYLKNRLNITNKSDGKTISVTSDRYASDDYLVDEVNYNGVGYQNINGTSILFQNKSRIEIYFSDIKVKMSFNE